MKIYTKTGDEGQTALWGGGRLPKSHPRVDTYGTLDEANSVLGLAIAQFPRESPANLDSLRSHLIRVQNELFQLGSELATEITSKSACDLIEEAEILKLETEIDALEKLLPPLQQFILPGGSLAGATLHIARTTVRRAERQCVALAEHATIRKEVIAYLNRLSDYLFVYARGVNFHLGQREVEWSPPKKI